MTCQASDDRVMQILWKHGTCQHVANEIEI